MPKEESITGRPLTTTRLSYRAGTANERLTGAEAIVCDIKIPSNFEFLLRFIKQTAEFYSSICEQPFHVCEVCLQKQICTSKQIELSCQIRSMHAKFVHACKVRRQKQTCTGKQM